MSSDDPARYDFLIPDKCPFCKADHTELVGTAILCGDGKVKVGIRCHDCGEGWWISQPLDVQKLPANRLKKWRECILAQDKYRCHICGTPGGPGGKALFAHHLIPKINDPKGHYVFTQTNGIAVCWDCHRRIHGDWMDRYNKKGAEND